MTDIGAADRRLITRLAVVRAGIEAMNESLFAEIEPDDATILRNNHAFQAALEMIRRVVPDHVLDSIAAAAVDVDDPPTRPVLTLVDTHPDDAA